MQALLRSKSIGLLVAALAGAGSATLAMAQAPAASAPPAAAVAQPVLPLVDASRELKGRALVEALRAGGHVLYMRHALQIAPTPGPCVGSNLQPAGEVQARTVGAAIRALNIPIGSLRSSEPCRNRDTARLLDLGEVEISTDLNPVPATPDIDIGAARTRQLMQVPKPGTNTLLVSHTHGSRNTAEWMHLELAEIIVYRPDGKNPTAPVARIRVEGWEGLIKAVQ